MAYTLFKRAPRCFDCRRRDVALFILHGSTGLRISVLCASCAHPWGSLPGVTASPLGNLRHGHRRHRRRFSPARG